MNFNDIMSLFRQGKGTARSHIKNLIEMAVVDGAFDLIEFDLLKQIAKRNNISESHLKTIQDNPGSIQFIVPSNEREKFNQFYDLVRMMTVDNSIHTEEMKLCNLFAIKFGYNRDRVAEIIDSVQNNIKNGQSYEETYRRVEWMLN
jgi:uncharacterized tellurite resistance protein B-like protein